jgi:hypothetical protein
VRLREEVQKLFEDLDILTEQYDEVTDTEVSDNVRLVLNYCFVWGRHAMRAPRSYGMFSAAGDKALATIVNQFLVASRIAVDGAAVPIGKPRNDLLQSVERTARGRATAEFIGVCPEPLPPELPDELFERGEYEP